MLKYFLSYQVHNSIRPYACTYCEAKFARVSHLNRHIRTHTGERPFACERCGKSFARQDKLKLHMDRHLSRENKSELMTQLLQSPPKKIKLETKLCKQETVPGAGEGEGVAGAVGGYTMMGGGGGLWGAFPGLAWGNVATGTGHYQAVYPGMVAAPAPAPAQQQPYCGGGGGAELQQLQGVMKIGECSIRPLAQP